MQERLPADGGGVEGGGGEAGRRRGGPVGEQAVREVGGQPEGLGLGAGGGVDGHDHAAVGDGAVVDVGGRDHEAVEAVGPVEHGDVVGARQGFVRVVDWRLGGEAREAREDFAVGLGDEVVVGVAAAVGEPELFVEAGAELDGGVVLPACGADEGVGVKGCAVG